MRWVMGWTERPMQQPKNEHPPNKDETRDLHQ